MSLICEINRNKVREQTEPDKIKPLGPEPTLEVAIRRRGRKTNVRKGQ